MKTKLSFVFAFIATLIVGSCGGGGGGSTPTPTPPPPVDPIAPLTACTNTAEDSQPGLTRDNRIRSHLNGVQYYYNISGVRFDVNGDPIDIDFMVHSPPVAPKALVVLISGGNGNANITGIANNLPATSSGWNFLIRSAHLIAEEGYITVSVDRSSEHEAADTPFAEYNSHRTSVAHAVDLSRIINHVNVTNLPVIIAGSSRGAISAVAQHKLADALALSSVVTDDVDGAAVDENATNPILRPSSVTVPAHVMWHINDACATSPVAGSEALVTALNPDAPNNPVSGGFNGEPLDRECDANTFHGFYGIESCALGLANNWLDGVTPPPSKPTTSNPTYNLGDTEPGIDLSLHATAAGGGTLSFELPFTETTLGGTVSVSGNIVTYTKPPAVWSTSDSFVYVVKEEGGGTSHNVINIILPGPPI